MFDLLQPILVIVVAYLVRAALRVLNVKLEEGVFHALVAAIVVYLLGLLGVEQAARLLG